MIPDSANYVSCNHCNAQLAVRREESITFTEQLENIAERTGTLESELRQLTINNQLIAHDQWWEKNRQQFLVSTKQSGLQEPMEGRGVFGGVGILLGGGVCIIMFANSSASAGIGVPIMFAIVLCIIAYVVYLFMTETYRQFNRARISYQKKRRSIAAGDQLPDTLK